MVGGVLSADVLNQSVGRRASARPQPNSACRLSTSIIPPVAPQFSASFQKDAIQRWIDTTLMRLAMKRNMAASRAQQ
jgi:hypothetical protein